MLSSNGFSQTKIQWYYSYNAQLNAIEIQATLADGWHLYSQHVANEIGPVPTSFVFEPNDAVKFIGKVNEPQPIQKYDENFEAMLDFFEGKVLFTQRLSVKQNTIITGTLTYMLCNDVMCLPPVDEKFKITITK
jgi:thiol:disulfide interchange protein DsbD